MVLSCIFCGSKWSCENKRTFHQFPFKQPEIFQEWLKNLGMRADQISPISKLCSDHFESRHLLTASTNVTLAPGSIPTILGNYKFACSYCKRKGTENEALKFYRFPFEKEEILKKWISNVPLPNFLPSASSILCSNHFEQSCYYPGGKLKPTAVPNIFPPLNNEGMTITGDDYGSEDTDESYVIAEGLANDNQPEQDNDVSDSLVTDEKMKADGGEYELQGILETTIITEDMVCEEHPEEDAGDYLNIDDTQFKWTHESTLLMLNEYYKLRDEFRDPKIKNTIPWGKIKSAFYYHGYKITKDCLSTKFRNLKKTFSNIRELKSKKARKGKITWVYYKYFLKIYKSDPKFNKTNNKKPENVIYQAVPAMTNVMFTPAVPFTLFRVTPANDSVRTTPMISSVIPALANNSAPSSHTITTTRRCMKRDALIQKKQIQEARKQEVLIDEKRSIEIKKLVQAIKQNNVIQRERNRLLKEVLDLI